MNNNEEKKPNGVYLVAVVVTKHALVQVAAASEKEAKCKVLQNIGSIDKGDFFGTIAESCWQAKRDIDVLTDEVMIYDAEFTRMSLSDYKLQQQEASAMLEEGGAE